MSIYLGDDSALGDDAEFDLSIIDDDLTAMLTAWRDEMRESPPQLVAKRQIHAAAECARVAAAARVQQTARRTVRPLARFALASGVLFLGTTGLAAADILPPGHQAVARVAVAISTPVVDLVSPSDDAPKPPPSDATPAVTTPAPAARPSQTAPPEADVVVNDAVTTPPAPTTEAPALSVPAPIPSITAPSTSVTTPQASTSTVPDDGPATGEGVTTTVPAPTTTEPETTSTAPASTTTTTPADGPATAQETTTTAAPAGG